MFALHSFHIYIFLLFDLMLGFNLQNEKSSPVALLEIDIWFVRWFFFCLLPVLHGGQCQTIHPTNTTLVFAAHKRFCFVSDGFKILYTGNTNPRANEWTSRVSSLLEFYRRIHTELKKGFHLKNKPCWDSTCFHYVVDFSQSPFLHNTIHEWRR